MKIKIEIEVTPSLALTLENIANHWRNLEEDGVKPFKNWTTQEALQETLDLMGLDKEMEIKAKQLIKKETKK